MARFGARPHRAGGLNEAARALGSEASHGYRAGVQRVGYARALPVCKCLLSHCDLDLPPQLDVAISGIQVRGQGCNTGVLEFTMVPTSYMSHSESRTIKSYSSYGNSSGP